MSGAYLRTRIVDISFAIYAPSWLVSVRLAAYIWSTTDSTGGGRRRSFGGVCGGGGVLVVESVLTGGPDRPRPGSMVTIHSAAGRIASSFSKTTEPGHSHSHRPSERCWLLFNVISPHFNGKQFPTSAPAAAQVTPHPRSATSL